MADDQTDQDAGYGLGALPDPDDERDFPAALGFDALGVEPDQAPPPSHLAPAPFAPVYNQGSTPQCVAYSSASSKVYQDLRDTGAFDPAFAAFFHAIGGTPEGAYVRSALDFMRSTGYHVTGRPAETGRHRIASYVRLDQDALSLQQAILAFGPILLSTRWHRSWFRPKNGVLPAPDALAGGHAIVALGWTETGLVLQNSWGSEWGDGGRAILPWPYLSEITSAWSSLDVVIPAPSSYTLRVAARARVQHTVRTKAGCLRVPWSVYQWGAKASSARCERPVRVATCAGNIATVARVTSGTFTGRWVHIGNGVSVTSR